MWLQRLCPPVEREVVPSAGGDDVEDDTEDDSVDMDVVGASASGACTNIDPKAALFAKPLE